MDPDSGEDAVADSTPEESTSPSPETDPHLLLYNLLFDEIRSRIGQHYRSLLTGLSVIGLVMAYGLLTGELVFLAVIPVIIAVLFVQTVRHLNSILYSARHLKRIESEYSEEYQHFEWETRYGMTGDARRVSDGRINWTLVPAGIMYVFAVLAYVGFAYVGYVVWPPDGIDIIAVGLSRTGLIVIYVLLTVMVCLVGYSYYVHRVEFGQQEG